MASNGKVGRPTVYTKWASGVLQWTNSSLAVIFGADPTNRFLTVPAGSGIVNAGRSGNGAAVAETYAATVSIDTTKPFHRIAGANGTSAASTYNASTTGNDGDVLVIETTSTVAGTCTITFGTNFKPSTTLAVTASHYGSVGFISDGTNWKESWRSAIIAS